MNRVSGPQSTLHAGRLDSFPMHIVLIADVHTSAISACVFVEGASQAALTADTRGGLLLHNISAYVSIMGAPCTFGFASSAPAVSCHCSDADVERCVAVHRPPDEGRCPRAAAARPVARPHLHPDNPDPHAEPGCASEPVPLPASFLSASAVSPMHTHTHRSSLHSDVEAVHSIPHHPLQEAAAAESLVLLGGPHALYVCSCALEGRLAILQTIARPPDAPPGCIPYAAWHLKAPKQGA